jgi:prepilin-type processing-associated H-X9-DG protein
MLRRASASPLHNWSAGQRRAVVILGPPLLLLLGFCIRVWPVFHDNQWRMARHGFFPVLRNSYRLSLPRAKSSCMQRHKAISIAVMQYQVDYAKQFPVVSSGGNFYGWSDALQPYLGDHRAPVRQCPQEFMEEIGSEPRKSGYTDFWFNGNLNGAPVARLTEPTQTILLGDGNDGTDQTDARYSLSGLPPRWIQNPDSPAYRHLGGSNFAFADGHIKWLRQPYPFAQNVKNSQRRPSFSIR